MKRKEITLSSPILIIKKIKKPTKSKFFGTLKVGDPIKLEKIMNSHAYYASQYKVIYVKTGEGWVFSEGNLNNRLENFEFEVDNR